MTFTKVAPAGIGTSPGTSILIGDSLLHSTGIDIGSNTGVGVTIRQHGDATFTGIVTASSFSGDITGKATELATNATGTNLTLSGNLGVGGVVTYEDVTNIDSVGVITARSTVSIADSIIHTGDTNTSLRFPAADTITAETGGLERLRIKSNGYVGIGTENPQRPLAVTSGTSGVTAEFNVPDNAPTGSAGLSLNIVNRSNSGYAPLSFNATLYTFGNSGTERLRIDNNGRFLLNLSSSITGGKFQVNNQYNTFFAATNDANGCVLQLQKTRSTSPDSYTIVQDGDKLGELQFKGSNGSGAVVGANIQALVNGTPGSGNDLPTDLVFRLMPDGSGSTLERLRITATGKLLLGAGAVATPKATQAGSLDLDSGGISLCIGGNENSSGRTNSTNKLNRVVTPHYTNAEEPMAMISGYSTSGQSELFYGGGSGLSNAVTAHHFYTAANTTTTTGTERIRLESNGKMIVGEANTSPVNDLEVRRANAGGDVAIRIGNNSNQDSGTTASLYFTTSPTQDFNTFYIQAARSDGSTRFGYGSSENMRLSNDGNLSIRTTGTPNLDIGADYGLYIAGSTYQKAGMAIRVDANDDNPASITLAKSRSSGDTIVGNYDDVGQLQFMANDGNGFHTIARIMGSMDGENSVPGNNDMPGNLRFFTCEDGGTSLTERARIHSWGGLELSNCKIDYGSCEPSHSYFYTFHKSGTYSTFYVDIGFMNPGGYNLEMMMGGYNNRKMHTTMQGYVYNGSHYGGVGAVDSGNGPQRSFTNIGTYGSYGTKMRFSFTSMSSTHTVVTMRLSFGPAGGTGRASRAEIYDVQWS